MKKTDFRKGIAKTLLVLVATFVLSLCGMFVACGDPENQTSSFTAEVSDVYLKLNDTDYDFTAGLETGVTVDSSKVNVGVVGSYEIVYTQNGVDVKKTAYVYGMPTMTKDGQDVAESYSVTYAQAKTIDFMDAGSMGITAKDSFDGSVEIIATTTEYYVGRYGDYTVTYTATDKAGNVTSKNVTFTVNGVNAPTVTYNVADVVDERVKFDLTLTENEIDGLLVYFNDTFIEKTLVLASTTGVEIATEAVYEQLENGVREFTVKFDNEEWYVEKEIVITDEKPLELGGLPFDNWVYQGVSSFEVPAPQKAKPQNIEFEYSVVGVSQCEIQLIAERETLIVKKVGLGNLDFGAYEITVSATRGEEEPVRLSATVGVYDEASYSKTIAPMSNEQHFNQFMETDKDMDTEIISLELDTDMGAYRIQNYENNGFNSIKIVAGSEVEQKISSAITAGNKYLVFDIYSESIDFASYNMWIYFNNWAGTATARQEFVNQIATSIYVCETGTANRITNKANIAKEKWYSIYVELGAFTSEAKNKELLMIRQAQGVYYIKDLRIADALPKANVVVDGGEYSINTEIELPVDKYGSQIPNTLIGPDGNVLLTNNIFTATTLGDYVATIGGVTKLNFKVVEVTTPVDPTPDPEPEPNPGTTSSVSLAEMDSNEDISMFMANGLIMSYDSTMNACKVDVVEAGNSIKAIKDGTIQEALETVIGENKYFAFDIYFDEGFNSPTSNIWFYINNFASGIASGGTQQIANQLNSSIFIFETGTVNKLTANTMTTGKWYTFFIEFNGFTATANNKDLLLFRGTGTCYLRNLRIEKETTDAKILATFSSASDLSLFMANGLTMSYDSTMNACKLDVVEAGNSIKAIKDGSVQTKITNAASNKNTYLKFEIYFDEDFTTSSNMWFYIDNFANQHTTGRQEFVNNMSTSIHMYKNGDSTRVTSTSSITTGAWYTIYVENAGLTATANNKDLWLFRGTGTCYIRNMVLTETVA